MKTQSTQHQDQMTKYRYSSADFEQTASQVKVEHTTSKQRFMDSLINSSIEFGSQGDSAQPGLLPNVQLKRRDPRYMSLDPHIAPAQAKKRKGLEPQAMRSKKAQLRQSVFNQLAMRNSFQLEQQQPQLVTLPQYYDIFKKQAHRHLLDEYKKDMLYDQLAEQTLRQRAQWQEYEDASFDRTQQPPFPSTMMAPMSDQNFRHTQNTRSYHSSFLGRPASLKINTKASEFYDFAKYSKQRLGELVAGEKEKMMSQMREKRLESLNSQGHLESSQTQKVTKNTEVDEDLYGGVDKIQDPANIKSCQDGGDSHDFYHISSFPKQQTPNTLGSQRISFNQSLQQTLPAIPAGKQRNDSIKLRSTGESIATDPFTIQATRLGTAAVGHGRGAKVRYEWFNNFDTSPQRQGEADVTTNKSPELTDTMFTPMGSLKKPRKNAGRIKEQSKSTMAQKAMERVRLKIRGVQSVRKNPKVKLQMTVQPKPYLESLGKEEMSRSFHVVKTKRPLLRDTTNLFADSFKELDDPRQEETNEIENENEALDKVGNDLDSKLMKSTSNELDDEVIINVENGQRSQQLMNVQNNISCGATDSLKKDNFPSSNSEFQQTAASNQSNSQDLQAQKQRLVSPKSERPIDFSEFQNEIQKTLILKTYVKDSMIPEHRSQNHELAQAFRRQYDIKSKMQHKRNFKRLNVLPQLKKQTQRLLKENLKIRQSKGKRSSNYEKIRQKNFTFRMRSARDRPGRYPISYLPPRRYMSPKIGRTRTCQECVREKLIQNIQTSVLGHANNQEKYVQYRYIQVPDSQPDKRKNNYLCRRHKEMNQDSLAKILTFLEGASRQEVKPPDFWLKNIITKSLLKKEQLMNMLVPPEDIEPTGSDLSINELFTREKYPSKDSLSKSERIHGWQDNYNDYIIRRLVPSSSGEGELTDARADSRVILKEGQASSASISTSQNQFSTIMDKEVPEPVFEDEQEETRPTEFRHGIFSFSLDRIKLKPVQALKLNIHEATRTRLCEAIDKKRREQEELRLQLSKLDAYNHMLQEDENASTLRVNALIQERDQLQELLDSAKRREVLRAIESLQTDELVDLYEQEELSASQTVEVTEKLIETRQKAQLSTNIEMMIKEMQGSQEISKEADGDEDKREESTSRDDYIECVKHTYFRLNSKTIPASEAVTELQDNCIKYNQQTLHSAQIKEFADQNEAVREEAGTEKSQRTINDSFQLQKKIHHLNKQIDEMKQHIISELKTQKEHVNSRGNLVSDRFSQVSSRISVLKEKKLKIEQKIILLQKDDSQVQLDEAGQLKKKQTTHEVFANPIQMEENKSDQNDNNELTEKSEINENYHESSKSEHEMNTQLEELVIQSHHQQQIAELESQHSSETMKSLKRMHSVKKQNYDAQMEQEESSDQQLLDEAQRVIDEEKEIDDDQNIDMVQISVTSHEHPSAKIQLDSSAKSIVDESVADGTMTSQIPYFANSLARDSGISQALGSMQSQMLGSAKSQTDTIDVQEDIPIKQKLEKGSNISSIEIMEDLSIKHAGKKDDSSNKSSIEMKGEMSIQFTKHEEEESVDTKSKGELSVKEDYKEAKPPSNKSQSEDSSQEGLMEAKSIKKAADLGKVPGNELLNVPLRELEQVSETSREKMADETSREVIVAKETPEIIADETERVHESETSREVIKKSSLQKSSNFTITEELFTPESRYFTTSEELSDDQIKDINKSEASEDFFIKQRAMFEKQQRVKQRKETLDHLFDKNRFLLKFNDYLVARRTEYERKRSSSQLEDRRASINQVIVDRVDQAIQSSPRLNNSNANQSSQTNVAASVARITIKHK